MDRGSWFDVRTFGARGDGTTLDTRAIQEAVDACGRAAGGTVYFPNGTWRSGTLFLRSGVTLRLEVGAVLQGSADAADYPATVAPIRYDHHANMDRAFLYAEDARDVAIVGPGTVDGNAAAFPKGPEDQRPNLLRMLRCRGVRLEGLRLRNPATWTTDFILCENVFCTGLDVDSRLYPNGNGLVFDSCRNVCVSDCVLNTSDDAICLQSSEREVPCRRVVVQNCVMSSHYAGMKIGMLSRGDIEDVTVSNCVLHDLECSGFKVQSAEGGRIRNLLFQNVVMRGVPRPVYVTLNRHRVGRASPPVIPDTGAVENLRFEGLVIENDPPAKPGLCDGIVVQGTPDRPVRGVTLRDVRYRAGGGCDRPRGGFAGLPELGTQRPEYHAFGGGLPAYALTIRHAVDVTVDGLVLASAREDRRFPVAAGDVEGLAIDGLRAAVHPEAPALALLEDVRRARLRDLRAEGVGAVKLQVEGEPGAGIRVDNRAEGAAVTTVGGAASAVTVL
jgi:hypothetical protein